MSSYAYYVCSGKDKKIPFTKPNETQSTSQFPRSQNNLNSSLEALHVTPPVHYFTLLQLIALSPCSLLM